MNERRTAAVLEAARREAAALDDAARRAFDADLGRVAGGAPAAVASAAIALLADALGSAGDAVHARLRVAVTAAEATAANPTEPLLFVSGRFAGLFAHAFGTDDRRATPGDVGALAGRTWELAGDVAAARRRLLAAAGADEAAVLFAGGARFLLLVGDAPEVRERLLAERARLERSFLAATHGEVVPVVSFVSASASAPNDAAMLAAGIADADRAQARTPFLDALEVDDAFGPFGEMADDASFAAEAERTREIGGRLRGARFALGATSRARLEPCADAAALARAAADADGGEDGAPVAIWSGTREGLRHLLDAGAADGRWVLEPAPLLPVWSEPEDEGPLAAVFARVDDVDGAAVRGGGFADRLAVRRAVDELLRVGAAGLAQGRSISVLFGGDDDLLACGPLRAVFRFVQRLEERLRETVGEDGPSLSVGIAAASPFARRGTDVARLARNARAEWCAAAAVGAGRTSALGAVFETGDVGRLLELGDDLVRLAREAPGPTRALLETALRVGDGGEAMPLSTHERLRARVHELASRLGVGARALRGGSDGGEPSSSEGLKTLVREFPAMFGSGVARVPLAYAVLLSEEIDA